MYTTRTQYGTWQDIEAHSVYPNGAKLERVACVETRGAYAVRNESIADASKTNRIVATSRYGKQVLEQMARVLGREGANTEFDRVILRRIGKAHYPREWVIERLDAYCQIEYKYFRELQATANAIEKRLAEDWAREQARRARDEERRANAETRRADFTDAEWARLNPFTRAAIERAERGEE